MINNQQFDYPQWLNQFISVYEQLNKNNLELLETLYHQDVHFQDPVHQISGLNHLMTYCNFMYSNTSHCKFCIDEVIFDGVQAGVYWTMKYRHPKLNQGNTITVEGHTQVKGERERVTYHRDYLDMGAMVYEHAPVLGRLVRWLKHRLAQ
ncbi:nuclear transport factor 2 family protein [Shewanella sp. 202IG2-18]|uniref:nuclear transport factor 2 family protein n=1 Tax=Parashewanella hymeniacidonis TaxID=2807618 RepID=UPI001960E7E7|nr:nuclear transport factor 2 family protein [Parashewanella hymeniacidonis]MBM7074354.1 nuclear transport factor 2 family protein [Parashewanella hymeniacidonis]